MAFPTVVTTAITDGTTATATPAINLPGSLVSGNLIFAVIRTEVAGTITWPVGWTPPLFEGSPDADSGHSSFACKLSNGGEGGTVVLGSGNGKFAGSAYQINGAEVPAIQLPELSTVAIGTDALPNPTTCTPTGGAKDYLWIFVNTHEGEQVSPPAANPTNYSSNKIGGDSGTAGAVTTNCRVALITRTNNAASEDAGSWTISASGNWSAWVVAVHPAAPVVAAAWLPGRASQGQFARLRR